MEKEKIVRTHRVGTVTFGCLLILFGVLFLAHVFVPWLHYEYVFRLWPLIFIFLGIEVLVGNYRASKTGTEGKGTESPETRFVYDKTAILLTVCLTFFGMVLAMMDYLMQVENWYIRF